MCCEALVSLFPVFNIGFNLVVVPEKGKGFVFALSIDNYIQLNLVVVQSVINCCFAISISLDCVAIQNAISRKSCFAVSVSLTV